MSLISKVGQSFGAPNWCRLHGKPTKFPLLNCPEVVRTVPSLNVPIRMPEFCCEFHQSSPCGGQERVHRQYLVQSWREP